MISLIYHENKPHSQRVDFPRVSLCRDFDGPRLKQEIRVFHRLQEEIGTLSLFYRHHHGSMLNPFLNSTKMVTLTVCLSEL